MPREKYEFIPFNDDDFNDAADILEAITLWDRLADTFKTDKLRDQIKAIASESILSHLIK